MGELEGWSQMGGGGRLLANGLLPNAGSLIDSLDSEKWLMAEERTAELITCIQPNQPSEERRNAVADYVQRLIMKCFPCQVFTFGSVPLKTYLPDGDIDLTAFSNNPNLKDSWASKVCDLLQTEEKNENAEFHVKEVQYIQAEVKIIKCLVENIVVDISFNQLGGLCTLCFLEEVDHLINQNHLFKRSIILIKAWCYYESRILGAHHGLISTYALETLVLYIFHVFNNSFAGPLEVLYRFLEFFSNFDWDNFCVSLWGPVPINSLPDVTAEPPRKDSGELLLSKLFDACSAVYAVFPGGQDNQGQPFISKHFNVVDPLRVGNNLGRSVSKGNFFRIRSAFSLGAKRLKGFLDFPKENVVAEVTKFFNNTWDRHGNGIRPDTPIINSLILKIDNGASDSFGKKSESVFRESDFDHAHSTNHQPGSSPKTHVVAPGHSNPGQLNLKSGLLVNDIQRSPFARTQSSPELTDTYQYVFFQGTHEKPRENGKTPNRKKNIELEIEKNEPSSLHHAQPKESFESSIESNKHHHEDVHQEEQDLVNMIASSAFHGFNGPVSLATGHLPFPISPSFLASIGHTQQNMAGMIPTNMSFIDPQFSGMQFPYGLVPHYFSGVNVTSKSEDSVNESNLGSVELNSGDDTYNHESSRVPNRVKSEVVPQDDNKPQSSSTGMNYIPPPRRVGGSGGLVRSQQKNNKEKRDQLRDNNHLDHSQFQENKLTDAYSDDRATSSRFSSAAHSNPMRSKTSSVSSRDETSTVNKSTKEIHGKKTVNPIEFSMSEHFQSEEGDQDWVPPRSFGFESESQTVVPRHGQRPHGADIDPAQTSGSSSVIPMGPMIIRPNPRPQMMENSGGTPLTFYPTGPPVPFLTMLPFYNFPSENGSTNASTSHFESMENSDISPNFHHEGVDQSVGFSPRGESPGETSDKQNPDILNSDFASHLRNLQFGRLCQSPRHHGPSVYPSPFIVPPAYLQGRVPWNGPGRPLPNMNLVTQLMNYGPRLVPIAPLQTSPNRHANVYQHYVEDMPKYRSGTGTYLPNPKVGVRDRPRKGNFNYDRSDNHGDRDSNSKPRASGRNQNHNRNQMDKPTPRLDRLGSSGSRSMNSDRHDSFSTYQTQNGLLHPGSSQNGPANVAYGMYPLPGVPPNGSNGPAVVMMYPFEQNVSIASQNEQLEFGSVGSMGFPAVNEQSPHGEGSHPRVLLEEHRLYSPDQPSSPHYQRRV